MDVADPPKRGWSRIFLGWIFGGPVRIVRNAKAAITHPEGTETVLQITRKARSRAGFLWRELPQIPSVATRAIAILRQWHPPPEMTTQAMTESARRQWFLCSWWGGLGLICMILPWLTTPGVLAILAADAAGISAILRSSIHGFLAIRTDRYRRRR